MLGSSFLLLYRTQQALSHTKPFSTASSLAQQILSNSNLFPISQINKFSKPKLLAQSSTEHISKQPKTDIEIMSTRAHSRTGSLSRQSSAHGHGSERGGVRGWFSNLGSRGDRQPAQRPPRRQRGPPPAAYDNRRRDIAAELGYVHS